MCSAAPSSSAPALPADESSSTAAVPSTSSRKGATARAKQLLDAAGQGDLEEVFALLKESPDGVNNLRLRGCTALHEAAKGGHLAVVADLLRIAADVNAVNRSGCTPLHHAVLCKDKHSAVECAKHLLEARASVNATGERMDTPLHFAAYCGSSPGCEGLIRCLLLRRASVNMRNKRYETALMNAALHDNADVVRLLLDSGAEACFQNSLSKTARDLAEEQGCRAALRVFEQQADPIAQLRDLSQQMSTALSQMQAPDWMENQLHSQSAMAAAYQAVARSVIAELDQESRVRLAEDALQALRAPGASTSAARRLQALATLRLMAQESGGPALLTSLGVVEALPLVDLQVAEDRAGQLALQELRTALEGRQQELAAADLMLQMVGRSRRSANEEMADVDLLMSMGGSTLPSESALLGRAPARSTSAATAGTGFSSGAPPPRIQLPHCSELDEDNNDKG